jgi:hypothetical protein
MTIWTARLAAALWVCAVLWMWRGRWERARWASTVGVVLYLAHVWCAFAFHYEWSHAVAYRETARQTKELFGVDWGGGLWLNYLFTAVWVGEVLWWRPRVRWWAQGFLGFMILNGTVVVWAMRWARGR